jgi:hypothetical protein
VLEAYSCSLPVFSKRQHFLYFFPLPQGQGALRPIFTMVVPFKIFISLAA